MFPLMNVLTGHYFLYSIQVILSAAFLIMAFLKLISSASSLAPSILFIQEIHELQDQIHDVESKYMQSLKEIKVHHTIKEIWKRGCGKSAFSYCRFSFLCTHVFGSHFSGIEK